jgi:hypothetical protein
MIHILVYLNLLENGDKIHKKISIFMETQTLLKRTNFSFQTYANSTICIF